MATLKTARGSQLYLMRPGASGGELATSSPTAGPHVMQEEPLPWGPGYIPFSPGMGGGAGTTPT